MKEILDDLKAEQEALLELLLQLKDSHWDLPSPAQGWTLRDCVSHIAHIDEVAVQILKGDLSPLEEAKRVLMGFNEIGVKRGRSMSSREILDWWERSRTEMLERLSGLDPKSRIPWFAMPMSAKAFATARLMETWAHGLDIFDAAGRVPKDTDRLRHVALLACLARPWAYQVNGLQPPSTALRVELRLPSGKLWSHGPEDAPELIRGSASEFCRVAVRRLHYQDTSLEAQGDEAKRFLQIAQTYAGLPGTGRSPKTSL
ncbi:MAG: TIGR03084 family metal-binding protein [bacterium]